MVINNTTYIPCTKVSVPINKPEFTPVTFGGKLYNPRSPIVIGGK
ncbi:MAG: hypothetical protein ACK5NI_01025 [bacterium]